MNKGTVNRINVSYCPCDEVTTRDVTHFVTTEQVAWQRIILITFLSRIAVLNTRTCVCEEESILLKLMLGDGSQDESEAESYDSCAVFDKQQEEAANKFKSP